VIVLTAKLLDKLPADKADPGNVQVDLLAPVGKELFVERVDSFTDVT